MAIHSDHQHQDIPVVLLHGWGGSFDSTYAKAGWLEALRRAGRQVQIVNLPGHGDWDQPVASGYYADLCGRLAERLPAGEFDAIGFSLGAKLLLEFCSRHPEQVHRAVIGGLGDNAFASSEPAGEPVAAVLLDEVGGNDSIAPSVKALVDYAIAGGGNPASMAAVLRRPPNPILTQERLAAVTLPIQLVNGKQDRIALPDDRLRAALPHHDYLSLDDVGHIDLTANPAFIDAAIAFICSPEASSS